MIDSPFFGWVLGLLLALSIYVTYHQYPMLFFLSFGPDRAWDETRSFKFRLIFHHMSNWVYRLHLLLSVMSFSCINSVRFALVFLFFPLCGFVFIVWGTCMHDILV